ncbi:MAG: hypothetical protein KKI09_01185 [Spirochaetes bacterium]|nr:hypothetical protein [Spirochaetota bacterium]MBU0954015.1 hypothetical protein [Spirochaetota bacterium]
MSLYEITKDMYGILLLVLRALAALLVLSGFAYLALRKTKHSAASIAARVTADSCRKGPKNPGLAALRLWTGAIDTSSIYRQLLYWRLFSLVLRIEALHAGCSEEEALDRLRSRPGFRNSPLAVLQTTQLRSRTKRRQKQAASAMPEARLIVENLKQSLDDV